MAVLEHESDSVRARKYRRESVLNQSIRCHFTPTPDERSVMEDPGDVGVGKRVVFPRSHKRCKVDTGTVVERIVAGPDGTGTAKSPMQSYQLMFYSYVWSGRNQNRYTMCNMRTQ